MLSAELINKLGMGRTREVRAEGWREIRDKAVNGGWIATDEEFRLLYKKFESDDDPKINSYARDTLIAIQRRPGTSMSGLARLLLQTFQEKSSVVYHRFDSKRVRDHDASMHVARSMPQSIFKHTRFERVGSFETRSGEVDSADGHRFWRSQLTKQNGLALLGRTTLYGEQAAELFDRCEIVDDLPLRFSLPDSKRPSEEVLPIGDIDSGRYHRLFSTNPCDPCITRIYRTRRIGAAKNGDSDDVREDWGVIQRFVRKDSQDVEIIKIQGLSSLGTQGAAKYFAGLCALGNDLPDLRSLHALRAVVNDEYSELDQRATVEILVSIKAASAIYPREWIAEDPHVQSLLIRDRHGVHEWFGDRGERGAWGTPSPDLLILDFDDSGGIRAVSRTSPFELQLRPCIGVAARLIETVFRIGLDEPFDPNFKIDQLRDDLILNDEDLEKEFVVIPPRLLGMVTRRQLRDDSDQGVSKWWATVENDKRKFFDQLASDMGRAMTITRDHRSFQLTVPVLIPRGHLDDYLKNITKPGGPARDSVPGSGDDGDQPSKKKRPAAALKKTSSPGRRKG